jgi:predicted nucleic acid-binding protein
MIKVLIDTNVVIDVILEREFFYVNASTVFRKLSGGELRGYISASAATDIFYLIRKERGKERALEMLQNLVKKINILPVHESTIRTALSSGWSDFEDAVQAQVALENGVDAIVTRNAKDYRQPQNVEILSPPDFIEYVDSGR